MIIVSGLPRCGSSMMMQTLHYLGVPLVGEKSFNFKGNSYLHRQQIPKKYHKKIAKHNTKGFYDIPIELIPFFLNADLEGRAIKLLGDGFLPHIKQSNVEKVIFCRRQSIIEQATSLQKLALLDLELVEEEVKKGFLLENSIRPILLRRYGSMDLEDIVAMLYAGERNLLAYWSNSKHTPLEIIFEDMLTNPEENITKVKNFLDLDVDIEKAVRNINTNEEAGV